VKIFRTANTNSAKRLTDKNAAAQVHGSAARNLLTCFIVVLITSSTARTEAISPPNSLWQIFCVPPTERERVYNLC
jgi:hypothetical protein